MGSGCSTVNKKDLLNLIFSQTSSPKEGKVLILFLKIFELSYKRNHVKHSKMPRSCSATDQIGSAPHSSSLAQGRACH